MAVSLQARTALKTSVASLCAFSVLMLAGDVSAAALSAGQRFSAPAFQDALSNQLFLQDLNADRVANDEPPLALNDQLDAAAQAKVQDMIANNYWAHFRPSDHKAPWDFIQEAGYNYTYAGENLAKGFRTEGGITQAWMNSPEHRANMLSPHYQDVGFATEYTYESDGSRVLLTVEMFGAR